MLEKTLFFETTKVEDVEGIVKILQSTLPSLGYRGVPGPGVRVPHRMIDNRSCYFESNSSGCYYKFRLDKGRCYRASIQFKEFAESNYELVLREMSQKFPQFFLAYASK